MLGVSGEDWAPSIWGFKAWGAVRERRKYKPLVLEENSL